MADVVRLNFNLHWNVPALVELDNGSYEMIDGPADALRHMRQWSKSESSEWFREAVSECMAAIRTGTNGDDSRAAFLYAYADETNRSIRSRI